MKLQWTSNVVLPEEIINLVNYLDQHTWRFIDTLLMIVDYVQKIMIWVGQQKTSVLFDGQHYELC